MLVAGFVSCLIMSLVEENIPYILNTVQHKCCNNTFNCSFFTATNAQGNSFMAKWIICMHPQMYNKHETLLAPCTPRGSDAIRSTILHRESFYWLGCFSLSTMQWMQWTQSYGVLFIFSLWIFCKCCTISFSMNLIIWEITWPVNVTDA